MTIDFESNHMQTLVDLKALAEKHNCKIQFGFLSSSYNEIDNELLEQHGFTEEMYEEMREKMLIKDCQSSFDKVWFELYDKNNGKYNTMAYIESCTYFVVEHESYFYERETSDELLAKLEEHDQMYESGVYTINLTDRPTIIHGFGNKETVKDYRVYRSGMALAFFGDLVCDYLNEPRIKRVY